MMIILVFNMKLTTRKLFMAAKLFLPAVLPPEGSRISKTKNETWWPPYFPNVKLSNNFLFAMLCFAIFVSAQVNKKRFLQFSYAKTNRNY